MAFQLDSNVFNKQRSLSDYIAVNEARDLQRAQAEQSMAVSDMTMQAARQKQEMEAVGMGLAGATEQDYPARRQALLEQGVPEQFLPEQYNPALIDAIMTKTGYKSKPSLAEQLMQPLSMMMGVQQPTPEPTQSAAPVPTGSITTNNIPAPSGNMDDLIRQDLIANGTAPSEGFSSGGSPNIPMPAPTASGAIPEMPSSFPEPTSVPLPQPLPNLQTTVPAYQPKTVGGAFEADKAGAKASAENAAKATQPITPIEQAKLNADLLKQERTDTSAALKQASDTISEINVAARGLEDFSKKIEATPEWATGPVMGRATSAAGYTPTRNLISAQNALTLSVKTLLKMPSNNFSNTDRDFLIAINDAVTSGKEVGRDAVERISRLMNAAAETEQAKVKYINEKGTIKGFMPKYNAPNLGNQPTPQAIEYLKANPDLADQFEQKYGVKANQYLGQ